MPYRRLPNTDQARLRALRTANSKGSKTSPFDLAFSQRVFLQIKAFLPLYEQAIEQYNFSKERQAKYGKLVNDQFKITRLYVSHFLQVLNFSIIRGEIKPEVRLLFSLKEDDKSVPEMGTEQQLIYWSDKIIKGEEKRMALGGNRIYNPSIAIVKIKFEKFLDYYNNHKNLQVTTQKMHDKVTELREKADNLIVYLWNEVEASFENLPGDTRREECTNYGIVYMLRKQEKELS
jgi:hypothetical protein